MNKVFKLMCKIERLKIEITNELTEKKSRLPSEESRFKFIELNKELEELINR